MISDDHKPEKIKTPFEIFMEIVNDLVVIIDQNEDFSINLINKCLLLDKLGYSDLELIGKPFKQIISSDDFKRVEKFLKKGVETFGSSQELKLSSVKKENIWVEIKAKKFNDENKNTKILLILKDISKQKKIEVNLKDSDDRFKKITETIPEIRFWKLFNPKKYEEALQSSYEMLQMVMENIPQYIIWKDTYLNYLGCNDNYANLIMIEHPENIIDKTDEELFWDKNQIDFNRKQEIQVIESNKAVFHSVETWTLRNGEIIWTDVNRIPLLNSDGKVAGLLITFEDITERKNAEENLQKQHKKLRDLLETSTIGVLEIELEKNSISYLNPKLLEFIGYQDISIVNEILLNEIIHPDDLKKLLNSEEGKEIEFRIVTKLEKIKWLQGKRLNQYDEKNKLISFRLWLEDVTEKKMYEELIYELNINFLNYTTDTQQNIELLLMTCLKLLKGAVVLYINKSITDEEEQYRVMSSKGDVKIYPAEQFKRELFVSQVFHENHDFTQEFYDIDESEYAKTDNFIMEYNIKACYGKLILSGNDLNDLLCVLFTENPIISNQNKLVLFLICDALEIEQRRWRSQQHLEEQNRMLSEINKLKSDLFSRTSHELKTPLISIKGFTELLLKLHSEKLDDDVISILEEIKNGSKRLEDYINSLVESSQLEQGLMKIRKEKENLTFLINYCVKQLQGIANLREQKIKVNIKEKIFSEFDKEKIYEVITNLLINAIKYTPVGGHIIIDSKQKDGHYIISIKDTGIGLTQKEISQLFTQFGKIERYGQGWDVGIEGTGLGLYISKELMVLHDGKIWASSEGRNKGSTFFFSLPIIEN
jgi:PAS domain S-box-containing protein